MKGKILGLAAATVNGGATDSAGAGRDADRHSTSAGRHAHRALHRNLDRRPRSESPNVNPLACRQRDVRVMSRSQQVNDVRAIYFNVFRPIGHPFINGIHEGD
jgi:hypothetical protein